MQLQFAFEILSKNEPMLKDTKLVLEEIKAIGKCSKCDFKGPLSPAELPEYHFKIPSLDCPKCKEKLEIIKGRDLVIKDIEIEK
jgi:Zn finger protein HypA/HybF involved in hydrogenase expression